MKWWPFAKTAKKETFEEYAARIDAYVMRPDVVERSRKIPPSFTYNRETENLTRIDKDGNNEGI